MLKMFAMLCRLSSFLTVRIFTVIILPVSFFRLCSFGVVLRFGMSRCDDPSWSLCVIVLSWGLLVLCG